jgi:hypothetical protein
MQEFASWSGVGSLSARQQFPAAFLVGDGHPFILPVGLLYGHALCTLAGSRGYHFCLPVALSACAGNACGGVPDRFSKTRLRFLALDRGSVAGSAVCLELRACTPFLHAHSL